MGMPPGPAASLQWKRSLFQRYQQIVYFYHSNTNKTVLNRVKMSLLQPKAIRDGNKLKKRLQNEAQKAYDKHKLAEDQLEAERLKLLSKAAKEESSDQDDRNILDTRGLYFADIQTLDAGNEGETDSLFSTSSAYTRNFFINKFCLKFLITNKRLRLSWKEYMCYSFILHVHIGFLRRHLTLLHRWGTNIDADANKLMRLGKVNRCRSIPRPMKNLDAVLKLVRNTKKLKEHVFYRRVAL
ncbi:hypothetical protein Trydic_g3073 [Trypoxylus dichotomus]